MNTTVKTGPSRPGRARSGQARAGQTTGGQAAAPPQPRGRRPVPAVTTDRRAGPASRVASAPPGRAVTTGPARAARAQPQARKAGTGRDPAGAGRPPVSRTPFILLVVGLLSGGLLCLLVINTTLAAGSLKINGLQQSNAEQAQRVQQLQQQVATDESPSSIEQRALRLGMRMQPVLDFVDLRNDRSYTTPARVTGANAVSGYTP